MSAIGKHADTLLGLLDQIGDRKLHDVVRLLESSGQRQRLEPALAAMRPRLRQLRPARPPTLERLLTVPLELVLVADDSPHSSFGIRRSQLQHWQARLRERLAPAVLEAARIAIADVAEHDCIAMLGAGRQLWPEAAAVLRALDQRDEAPEVVIERQRLADCLAIGPELVPLAERLLPLEVEPDGEGRTALAQWIELALAGPPDRLGTLLSALLRATLRPWATAHLLLEIVPSGLSGRLPPLLEQLLAQHRRGLERLVTGHKGAPNTPLPALADDLFRLAEALTSPADGGRKGGLGICDKGALSGAAVALATERCTVALQHCIAPLPAHGTPERTAAVKAREATARQVARLVQAMRRLAPDNPSHLMVESAIEQLVDIAAVRGATGRSPVSVDDARLIEILIGPDIAWNYLRPHRTSFNRP